MVSPFPGMDPFIEGDSWQDFHLAFIAAVRELLVPQVRPNYLVRAQERVYLEHLPGDGLPRSFGPDVSVVAPRGFIETGSRGGTAMAVAAAPVIISLPMPLREREHYLTILWRDTMEVVTIVEVLSPSNKRRGSDGRREYVAKREAVLLSGSHLVELDLLRGGERLPTLDPLPSADYYAVVSRVERRPSAEAYGWAVLEPMPAIPIPLTGGDADVTLDIQQVFNSVYEHSDYDYSLDYSRSLEPPLNDADTARVQEAVQARSR